MKSNSVKVNQLVKKSIESDQLVKKSIESDQLVKKPIINKPIKVMMDGIEFKTLTDAIISDPKFKKIDGKHTDLAVNEWNKVNRQLKKLGEYESNGHKYKLI